MVLDTKDERSDGYVGMVYGNYYLQIDYSRDGSHYSEKVLIMENHEESTTELFFASGSCSKDFDAQKSNWENLVEEVKRSSEKN